MTHYACYSDNLVTVTLFPCPEGVTVSGDLYTPFVSQGHRIEMSLKHIYAPFPNKECKFRICSSNFPDTTVTYETAGMNLLHGLQHDLPYEIRFEILTEPTDLIDNFGNGNYTVSGLRISLRRRDPIQ